MNENVLIASKIPLYFITKGPINNIPAFVQIMAWRRPGNKPLSEPMMFILLTHICATQPNDKMTIEQIKCIPQAGTLYKWSTLKMWSFNNVIMDLSVSGLLCHSTVCSAACSGWHQRKYQSSASLAICVGNPPVTNGFPSQRPTTAESFSMVWCHRVWTTRCIFGVFNHTSLCAFGGFHYLLPSRYNRK